MRILVVHNFYLQPGGEDYVYRSEADLLRAHGQVVDTYEDFNAKIVKLNKWQAALSFIWNADSARRFEQKIIEYRPDIVHFHNTFPLISPAVYYVCLKYKLPMVQTLHNSRLICPAARFFRSGHLCTDCLGKSFPWPGVWHRCYHHSALQTFLVGLMSRWHFLCGLWTKKISAFIVFTKFYKKLFYQWGIPQEKIFIKPHFIADDPGVRTEGPGTYALFVGRLGSDKGVKTLLDAWGSIRDFPLWIAGDGEDKAFLEKYAQEKGMSNIKFLGNADRQQIFKLIKGSRFVIIPSEVAETFSLVAIEAFACGIPVLCSKIGGLTEIVEEGKTGQFFQPSDIEGLTAGIRYFINHLAEIEKMGQNARRVFEKKFSPDVNHRNLMDIYVHVLLSKF